MNFLKKLSKRSRLILIFSMVAIMIIIIAVQCINDRGEQKETYTVKNYKNMAENNLANEVREYMKTYSDMDDRNIDAVTEVAVKDYNTVLNSGIDGVTDEHSGAVEESIKRTLLFLLQDTDTDLSEGDIDYLSNGICQIIWNALLEALNSNDAMLSEKYEEQYIAFTASLQKQIDELAERSTAISITANIKQNEEGISASDLESAKSDIYSEVHSELDSMKTEIRDDVMQNVSDGTDGRDGTAGVDGKDGSNGKDGKDGNNGSNGKSSYIHIRYSAYDNGKEMTEKPFEDSTYIGIYSGTEKTAPEDRSKYTWSKYKADAGNNGEDGKSSYTHIRYSAYNDGKEMTEKPSEDSAYIGIYNGMEENAPEDRSKYTWSRYRGNNGSNGQDGNDGADGADGENGIGAYVYVRYAEDMSGSGMSEQPNDRTYYIGIYSGNNPVAPDTADAYIWSKYRGNDSTSATYDAATNTVILTITK